MSTTVPAPLVDQPSIQPATWRDFNAVNNLEKASFPYDAWPLWDIIGVLTFPNIIRLKSVIKGQLVGFIAADIRRSQNLALIATLAVSPNYRRQGIGTDLLCATEKKLDVSKIRLTVRKSNYAAIKLYRKSCYSQIELLSAYYNNGEDALILEKQLL